METVGTEEREQEPGEDSCNGSVPGSSRQKGPTNPAKKTAVVPPKRKGKSKVRRRTVNPKKAKKNDRLSKDDSLSEEEGVSRGVARGVARKPETVRGGKSEGVSSDEREEDDDEELKGGGEETEEEEWKRLQQSLQKHSKKKFEQSATESHSVHAPYFPQVSWLVAKGEREELTAFSDDVLNVVSSSDLMKCSVRSKLCESVIIQAVQGCCVSHAMYHSFIAIG